MRLYYFKNQYSIDEDILKIEKDMQPESWLLSKFNSFKFERTPTAVGICPLKLLPYKDNVSSFDKFPRVDEIKPVKLLSYKNKLWSLLKEPNHDGISPLKLLLPKFKYFSRFKLANSTGKGPWKLLLPMSSQARKDKFPRWGWMVPVRPIPEKFRAVTL